MLQSIRSGAFSLLLTIVLAQTAYAQPTLITYSGRLTDGTGWGQSIPVDLEFRVYGSETGDTALWHKAFPGVAVEDGFFTVMLGEGHGGEGEPLAIADVFASTSQTWLGVVVDGVEVPRQRVGSVPYAVRAEQATGLGPEFEQLLSTNLAKALCASKVAPGGIAAAQHIMEGDTGTNACKSVPDSIGKTCKAVVLVALHDSDNGYATDFGCSYVVPAAFKNDVFACCDTP